MHRIDTPTAQADKFGPGKNGFTNGDPATGRRATDLNSDMWDAVQEEICAVIEKSGTALNKDQHDQLYQAIVKIITSKIPDALLRDNNLSDLADKALARANLQLKTAAVADVQTSKDDVTKGRVLINGSAVAVRSVRAISGATGSDVADANNLPKNSVSFVYSSAGNSPGITGTLLDFCGLNNSYNIQIAASYSGDNNQIKFRTFNGDSANKWNPWYNIYHSGNKPTAGDVGAIPLGGSTAVTGIIRNSAEFQTTSANSYRIVYGNYGVFWRQDGANLYLMLTNSGDQYGGYNSLRPLAINLATGYVTLSRLSLTDWTNFDARYQAKGNYTPAGQAYTKAESDARYQLKNTASRATNGWFKDNSTGMIFQWGRNSSSVVGNTTVTFPIAFPNACLNIQNTLIRGANTPGQSPWGFITSFNNASASISSDASGSYWYAIGY